MLEDQKIQHLISWSSSNESFVINPNSEFSKVLAYASDAAQDQLDMMIDFHIGQHVFQAHKHIIFRSPVEHVRLS